MRRAQKRRRAQLALSLLCPGDVRRPRHIRSYGLYGATQLCVAAPLYIASMALLRAGLPIVLWARQGCEEHGLRTLFDDHPLKGLETRVMEARRQAQYDPTAAHGRHLTLLWDDPERLPPTLLKFSNPR